MRQLIWKEWREKRWWLVPMALYPVGCVLARGAYSFLGLLGPSQTVELAISTPVVEVAISGLIALLMGLAAYAPELGGGTADFLYAKPAGWKKILTAKVAVAVGFIVASTVLAAVAFRIVCPEPYLRFATIPLLAKGAGVAALVMLFCYLMGMSCSVVLPGMLGSVLTLGVVFAIDTAAAMLTQTPAARTGHQEQVAKCLQIVTTAAILAAAFVVIRFGLTLSLGARVRRYAAIFLIILLAGSIAIFAWARTAPPRAFQPPISAWSFSPSGTYAYNVSNYGPEDERPTALRVYRLADGANAEFSAPGGSSWNDGWTSDDKVFALYHWPSGKPGPVILRLLWLDPRGKLRVREMRFPDSTYAWAWPSPSGRLALVRWSTWTPAMGYKRHPELSHRAVVDLKTFRRLDAKLPEDTDYLQWVSDSVLSYRPRNQKTHVRVRVGP